MNAAQNSDSISTAAVRLPDHVVYRAFPNETVLLNLKSGRYHGLNPTAGEMLATLEKHSSVATAASILADRYDVPRDTVEKDLVEFCSALVERGLLEIEHAG